MGNQPSNLDKQQRGIHTIVTQRSKSEDDFSGLQTQPNISTQTESDIPSRKSTNRRNNPGQPRPLTPNRQYPGKREQGGGLDYLACDSKPEMGKRLPPGEMKNINQALKFVGLHQAIRPEKGENIKINGGPLLGFDLETVSESFPLNSDFVVGRMSFSNNMNDFCQKFKFRVETHDTALETIKLDALKQDARFQGDRKKLLAETSKLDVSRGNRFFNVTPSLDREFSPEFVFAQNHSNSRQRENQNQFEEDSHPAFGQPIEYESLPDKTQSRRAVNYSDVQGAISRIKKKEEESQSPTHDRSPPRVASLPNINTGGRPTVFRPNNGSSNKSGKASPTNSPLRGTSPTFVIGKPEGTAGKSTSPKVSTTRSPIREKSSSTKQSPLTNTARPKSPATSKNPSSSGNQTVFVDLKSKKPASKPTIETSGSRSPHRHVIEGVKPQPQTTKAEYNKKFWKEAEKPSPTNRKTSVPKTNDKFKVETKSQPSSAASIPKTTTNTVKIQKNQNIKTDSSPLASEYIKYRYATNQSQGQLDASIPVKSFDLASHTPSTSHMSMAGGVENIHNSNNPYYSSIRSKPEIFEDKKLSQIEHPRYPPPQSEPESRDLNDLTSDDDIEPVEATLDLSAYMTRPEGTQSLQEPPRDFRIKDFSRGGSDDLRKYWESDSQYKRNTEPDLASKLIWQSEADAKKNFAVDVRTKHNNYVQSYADEKEDEPIEEREVEDNEREEDENEINDEDYSEDLDENSYVDGLKQRLAQLSGPESGDLATKVNRDILKGHTKKSSMRYEQEEGEDVDLKENDIHLSNMQRNDKVFTSGGNIFEKKPEPRSAGFITDNRLYGGKNGQRYFPENI